jgi:hypothetical protein
MDPPSVFNPFRPGPPLLPSPQVTVNDLIVSDSRYKCPTLQCDSSIVQGPLLNIHAALHNEHELRKHNSGCVLWILLLFPVHPVLPPPHLVSIHDLHRV